MSPEQVLQHVLDAVREFKFQGYPSSAEAEGLRLNLKKGA